MSIDNAIHRRNRAAEQARILADTAKQAHRELPDWERELADQDTADRAANNAVRHLPLSSHTS
jgi:hypothetical protein